MEAIEVEGQELFVKEPGTCEDNNDNSVKKTMTSEWKAVILTRMLMKRAPSELAPFAILSSLSCLCKSASQAKLVYVLQWSAGGEG